MRWAELWALLALRTRILTASWSTSRRSSRLCKWKLDRFGDRWEKLEKLEKVEEDSRRANWNAATSSPNTPNLICFRPPPASTGPAKAVAGTTTPLKSAAVRLSHIPFPLPPDTCGLLSLSRTLSRLSPWQRLSCELRICPMWPWWRRQPRPTIHKLYTHTHVHTTHGYAPPTPPIPRLRLLRSPSVTGGSGTAP